MDLKTLEFPAILKAISHYSNTLLGQEKIARLIPHETKEAALLSMREITSAKRYILDAKAPRFGDFFDLAKPLRDIKIARILSIQDLMRIRRFLNELTQVYKRLKNVPEDLESNALEPYLTALEPLSTLKIELDQLVDDEGLKENASSDLKKHKNALRVMENRLTQKLKNLVDQSGDMLSETFYTERQGRYVVPVKQTYKNRFKGSVVDYSASGETVYMEPAAVGEMSAEKRKIETAIEAEIERILTEISQTLHTYYETLALNHETIGTLDAIFAKAEYAAQLNMEMAAFGSHLALKNARHPLIDPKEVVPNAIELSHDTHLVIISGSNTGGKTVVLKTVGLLSLMALSGLLIPAEKGSSLPFYTGVYADIGDEQSIEQSLSTFSSHLTNIQRIIQTAPSGSLILLDEVGGGTDPKAGAAFARALMDDLSQHPHDIFVTTHYPELKAYAYDHPTAINASVAFDKETLKPTYHLYLDTPGESHALLIARRLGFKPSIIEKAEDYFQNEQNPVSDLIQTLEQKKAALETERAQLNQLKRDTDALKHDLQQEKADVEAKKQSLTDRFTRQYQRDKESLETAFEDVVNALKASRLKPHEINQAKDTLFQESPQSNKKERDDHVYQPGDVVHVNKFNRKGELKKALKAGRWQVLMGNVESTLDESEFYFVDTKKTRPKEKIPKASVPKKRVASELDLRGLRVEEAAHLLDKYLDDCALSKLPFARIIHGFGTFAIRDMVQTALKENPAVQRFRSGEGGEGGAGVTVVYF